MNISRISSVSRPFLLLSALAMGTSSITGCHFWNRLWGKDTVDLAKADIKSMSVDIRKERKTICPREPVQMAVFVEAVLDGDKDKKNIETWAGKGSVNKNDKLDFVEFAFQSDLGAFDKEGWFAPNASLLASTDKEFEIKTVYKKQPDKSRAAGRAGSSATAGRAGPPARGAATGAWARTRRAAGTARRAGRAVRAATGPTEAPAPTCRATRRW